MEDKNIDLISLNKALYSSTHSNEWKAIDIYLKETKRIIEEQLYDPNLTVAKTECNGAIVLIKMREIVNKLIELPLALEGDKNIEALNEEISKLTDSLVQEYEKA